MLADEEDSRARVCRENPLGDLDAAHRRQADIQQYQIRLERLCAGYRFRPVGGFADDLPGCTVEDFADVLTPGLVVINYENAMTHCGTRFSRAIQTTSTTACKVFERLSENIF